MVEERTPHGSDTPTSCVRCGYTPRHGAPGVSGSTHQVPGRQLWLCAVCTRDLIHEIETQDVAVLDVLGLPDRLVQVVA